MEALTLEALEAAAVDFDARVDRTQGIDAFCSSTEWILPAARALMPAREPFIRRSPAGYAAFMRVQHPDGPRILEPLEAMWCLGSPLVSPEPRQLLEELEAELAHTADWDALVVPGVAHGSPLAHAVHATLTRTLLLTEAEPTLRAVADLESGAEAWLGRRTANFRRSLRRAERDAEVAGIRFERVQVADADGALAAYARLLTVEARSWKGQSDSGLVSPEMREFYRNMVPRLGQRGALRIGFATHAGRDVGYILGGIRGSAYRGLQFSFDEGYRGRGLGNLLQWQEIKALAAEGVAHYDLGTDREYKQRWCDRSDSTDTLVFLRPPPGAHLSGVL